MSFYVCQGAILQCSFGAVPSVFQVTPENRILGKTPAASIMDFVPLKNILTFGMCRTITNPAVAAATAGALGVLTPVPCMPVVVTPWTPGASKVLIGSFPALHNGCKNLCLWGGVIEIKAVTGQDVIL